MPMAQVGKDYYEDLTVRTRHMMETGRSEPNRSGFDRVPTSSRSPRNYSSIRHNWCSSSGHTTTHFPSINWNRSRYLDRSMGSCSRFSLVYCRGKFRSIEFRSFYIFVVSVVFTSSWGMGVERHGGGERLKEKTLFFELCHSQ